ncbi:hypothetical protein [Dyella sp. Tek66A03]|uniref:hypothetical protein n=1 Tax=Dyella sp. Tek66A03 TaxID=3458298 RepID=UPI00403E4F26
MKSTKFWLALAIALSGMSSVHAQDAGKANIIRVYTDVVAPADQQAYEAGTKAFNQCLAQHGFKFGWDAWAHETGDTYSYSYTSQPVTWETFDAMQAAGKACDQALRTNVNPHLKSETSAFVEVMPDMAHLAKGAGIAAPFMQVTYFKLKPGHEASETFTDVAKKIAAAANKANWPGHFVVGKVREGAEGSPDFIVLWPAKNWGEVGNETNPTLWKMMEGVYGKDDTAALRKSLNDVVQESSSHVDRYNADLTYKPASK